MAILFLDGEITAVPPDGQSLLKTDADGNLSVVASDGTESAVGGSGVESVTGDGVDIADPANPVFSIGAALEEDVTTTTLVAPAASVDVTGLDGDADGDYDVYFNIEAAGASTPKLQINGADTNLFSQWTNNSAGTITGGQSGTTAALGPALSTGDNASGWIKIRSRTGGPVTQGGWRVFQASTFSSAGPASRNVTVVYTDRTTNITSLSIVADLAATSYMTVRKLHNPS